MGVALVAVGRCGWVWVSVGVCGCGCGSGWVWVWVWAVGGLPERSGEKAGAVEDPKEKENKEQMLKLTGIADEILTR